jgi:hypothetical protein
MSKVSLSRYVPFVTNICTLWALEPFLLLSKMSGARVKYLCFRWVYFFALLGELRPLNAICLASGNFTPLKIVTSYYHTSPYRQCGCFISRFIFFLPRAPFQVSRGSRIPSGRGPVINRVMNLSNCIYPS